jgi:flagellar biosynthesis/type III secretory pathway chaperone
MTGMRPPVGVDFDTAASHLLPPLERLETLLEAESSALGSGDFAALSEHVHRKRALLRDLEQIVSTLNVPGLRPSASAQWTRMLTRLGRCHALNQAIGAAVNSQMRHNDQLLRILGHDAEPVGYGPTRAHSGRASGRGRELGSC